MYSFSARHVLRYLRNITFKVTSLFFYTYKSVMDGCISVQSFTCFACAHYAKHDMKPVGSNMMINFRCGKSCFYNKTLTLFSLQNQFVLLPTAFFFQLSLIFQVSDEWLQQRRILLDICFKINSYLNGALLYWIVYMYKYCSCVYK